MEFLENQPFEQAELQNLSPAPLREEDIKRRFVPFLRDFYKYRYAIVPGTVQTSFDNVSEEGFIADGKVTFLKKDDPDADKREYFTCTFEATSKDKAAEVKYSLNLSYLIWDSVAFAAMFTAGFYLLSYALRTAFLYSLGPVGNVGLVVGVWALFFSLWFFAMRSWKKYRYIYAIAQFKQYFADEQWVALGDDVFVNPSDPFLQELKNQCIFNGFGLALVSADKNVRPIVTPSRLGIFGKDRKMTEWVTGSKLYRTAAQNFASVAQMRQRIPDPMTQLVHKLWRPIDFYAWQPLKTTVWNFLSKPFGQTTTAYDRFTQAQTTQKFLTVLGAFVTIFFLQKTLSHKEIEYADEKTYGLELRKSLRRDNPEDEPGYVVDDDPVQPGGIVKQSPEPLRSDEAEDEDLQTIDLSGGDEDEEIGGTDTSIEANDKSDETQKPQNQIKAPPSAVRPKRPVAKSPCDAVAGKKGWLVQDSYYSDKAFADERVAELRHRGLPVFAVPKSCLDKKAPSSGWIVFIGQIYGSESGGRNELDNFKKALKRYSLERGPLILRKL